jgi:hypothetical protein
MTPTATTLRAQLAATRDADAAARLAELIGRAR